MGRVGSLGMAASPTLRLDEFGEWKSANGFEVSSLGYLLVRDPIHGIRGPFQPEPNRGSGRREFSHDGKRYYAARVVCIAFHGPPPDGCTVDHINRNRADNRAENLKWATPSEQRLNQDRLRGQKQYDTNQNDLPGEQWRAIDRYMVSNMGRARTMSPHGNVWWPIFTPRPCRSNAYALIGRGNAFHRMVARAFLGEAPSTSHTVDHIDGDKTNNKLSNLRWATKSEQSSNTSRKRKSACLAKSVVVQQGDEWEKFDSFSDAARTLTSTTGQIFSSAGVGLAAKRNGTYHGKKIRLLPPPSL